MNPIYTCKIECFADNQESNNELAKLGIVVTDDSDAKTIPMATSFLLTDVTWWKATLDEMYPVNVYFNSGLVLRVAVSFKDFNDKMMWFYESKSNSK